MFTKIWAMEFIIEIFEALEFNEESGKDHSFIYLVSRMEEIHRNIYTLCIRTAVAAAFLLPDFDILYENYSLIISPSLPHLRPFRRQYNSINCIHPL
jgi:hypothetical protein